MEKYMLFGENLLSEMNGAIPEFYRAVRFWTRIVFLLLLMAALTVLSGRFTQEQFRDADPIYAIIAVLLLYLIDTATRYICCSKNSRWPYIAGGSLGFLAGAAVFYLCYDMIFQLNLHSLQGCLVFVIFEISVDLIHSMLNSWWRNSQIKQNVENEKNNLSSKSDAVKALTDEEKWIVSCHEAGHALFAELGDMVPVHSIEVKRQTDGTVGRTILEMEPRCHSPYEYFESMFMLHIAGRVAEEILLDANYNMVQDINEAKWDARRYGPILQYSIKEQLGAITLSGKPTNHLDYPCKDSSVWSEELLEKVKTETLENEDIQFQYEVVKNTLLEKKNLLKELARFMCEKESISGNQLRELIAQYKFQEVR